MMMQNKIPMLVKLGFTAFMLVLVPFYWVVYGPTNFLYFCDIALFLTLVGVWKESAALVSMAAVGILLPQFAWALDFFGMFLNIKLLGLTEYMFKDSISLFARGLSLFHGWLPFLLLYLLSKLGYCKKALLNWTLVAWGAMLVSFLYMPAPGDTLANPNLPVNINYVFGFSESSKQTLLSDEWYLAGLILILPLLVYWPTARLLQRIMPDRSSIANTK